MADMSPRPVAAPLTIVDKQGECHEQSTLSTPPSVHGGRVQTSDQQLTKSSPHTGKVPIEDEESNIDVDPNQEKRAQKDDDESSEAPLRKSPRQDSGPPILETNVDAGQSRGDNVHIRPVFPSLLFIATLRPPTLKQDDSSISHMPFTCSSPRGQASPYELAPTKLQFRSAPAAPVPHNPSVVQREGDLADKRGTRSRLNAGCG